MLVHQSSVKFTSTSQTVGMNHQDIRQICEATSHVGAKVAVICKGELITYLRDDFPHIHDPGLWDFPGGEREDNETAVDCVVRETQEEFGITLRERHLSYASSYASHQPGRADVAFFVVEVSPDVIASIRFGNEGQVWRMMPIEEFLGRADAIKELKEALRTYLSQGPFD